MPKTLNNTNRIEPYVKTATSVIADVDAALKDGPNGGVQARVLLPLVLDVKLKGETLLKSQPISVQNPISDCEHRLIRILENLDTIVSILRAMPKPGCPEDVLLDGH